MEGLVTCLPNPANHHTNESYSNTKAWEVRRRRQAFSQFFFFFFFFYEINDIFRLNSDELSYHIMDHLGYFEVCVRLMKSQSDFFGNFSSEREDDSE